MNYFKKSSALAYKITQLATFHYTHTVCNAIAKLLFVSTKSPSYLVSHISFENILTTGIKVKSVASRKKGYRYGGA